MPRPHPGSSQRVIRSNRTGSRRYGLDPFSPRATPIPRSVRAIRPSIVLEVGPCTLAKFVAGDRVGQLAVGHAGSIARALQVAADRIGTHLGGELSGIVVDLHIAGDVIPNHVDAHCDSTGIVADLQIAEDRAELNKAARGIVIAREISADRDVCGPTSNAGSARTVTNLNIASDGNRPC
jgi:hypothetical protein